MRYNVDIDGILCEPCDFKNYKKAVPKAVNIKKVNNLFESNEIVIYTSRKSEDADDTIKWLADNGVKYHSIIFNKPTADFYIDDVAIDNLPYIREREKDEQLVICMSGGLDSTIAYFMAKKLGHEPISLFFNVGQPYFEKEKLILDNLGIKYKQIDLLFYKDIENQGHIIPNRNSIFANVASVYGNRIWIVGLVHENHYLMHDKNDQFYRYVSLSLTQSTGKNVIVESPFREMSKTDIFNYCKENDLMEVAGLTTSCYHPTLHRCGECSLCYRRWVAEQTAGVGWEWSSNPRDSMESKKMKKLYEQALKEQDFSHYSKERIDEALKLY